MACPTDIVVMKVLAGRPKDIDDIVGILRARPAGLDLREARMLVQDLESMLDQSDLLAVLDAAVRLA